MKKLGVFLLVFGASALFNRADLSSVDEGFIFNTTAALVEKGSFRMEEELSGRRYSRFSPLPSLFAAPFYALTNAAIPVKREPWDTSRPRSLLFAMGLSTCVLTAWTAMAFVGLLRTLGYSLNTSCLTSLLWAFGTIAFPYSSSLFHQVMVTLLVVYVCRFLFAERPIRTAAATAILTSIQLTLALTVLPLFLRERGQWRGRLLVSLLVGVGCGLGIHSWTNSARGDHWLIGAYGTETFTTPTMVGTVGLFFSFGKGLLWFAPLAFAGLTMLPPFAYRRPEIGRPLLFAVACHCLVVIHWWAWHGSLTWGPRLLLPILPLMLIPIADLIERRHDLPSWQPRLVGTVAAISIFINVWAATQPMIGFLEFDRSRSMSEWVFIPAFSPLLNHSAPIREQIMSAEKKLLIASVVVSLCVLVMVMNEFRTLGSSVRTLAPWRAILLVSGIVVFGAHAAVSQYSNLIPDGEKALIGRLEFPIRGRYLVECDAGKDEWLYIGGKPVYGRFEMDVPPMGIAIKVVEPASRRMFWTLPGEGQYRSLVPAQCMTDPNGMRQSETWWSKIWPYHWMLYLVAVPLYFDWLLGGKRRHIAPGLYTSRGLSGLGF